MHRTHTEKKQGRDEANRPISSGSGDNDRAAGARPVKSGDMDLRVCGGMWPGQPGAAQAERGKWI